MKTTRITTLFSAAALGFALLGATAVPAHAVPDSYGYGHLLLTVADVDGSKPVAGAVLQCAPNGGSHPNTREACTELFLAGGDPAEIQAQRLPCLKIYQPVHVRAQGSWGSKRVDFEATYGNRCEMANATGAVFQIS